MSPVNTSVSIPDLNVGDPDLTRWSWSIDLFTFPSWQGGFSEVGTLDIFSLPAFHGETFYRIQTDRDIFRNRLEVVYEVSPGVGGCFSMTPEGTLVLPPDYVYTDPYRTQGGPYVLSLDGVTFQPGVQATPSRAFRIARSLRAFQRGVVSFGRAAREACVSTAEFAESLRRTSELMGSSHDDVVDAFNFAMDAANGVAPADLQILQSGADGEATFVQSIDLNSELPDPDAGSIYYAYYAEASCPPLTSDMMRDAMESMPTRFRQENIQTRSPNAHWLDSIHPEIVSDPDPEPVWSLEVAQDRARRKKELLKDWPELERRIRDLPKEIRQQIKETYLRGVQALVNEEDDNDLIDDLNDALFGGSVDVGEGGIIKRKK